MQLYNTCRFCKKMNYETPKLVMLKYGVRHWAHPECGIERFGAEGFFRKLHSHQLTALPWRLVERYHAEILATHPAVQFAESLRKLGPNLYDVTRG